MQEPYGEHNMQPQVIRHRRQALPSQELLQQAILQFNSRAPTLAANEEMHIWCETFDLLKGDFLRVSVKNFS